MRRIAALLGLAGLVLMACGGGGASASNPEDAVNGFLSAMKDADIDAMMQYVPEAEREEMTDEDKAMAEGMLGMMSDLDWTITGSEVSEDGNSATVTVELSVMDMPAEEEEIALIKEGGGWVISEGGMF